MDWRTVIKALLLTLLPVYLLLAIPAYAQTVERQELRLRVRTPSGLPVSNVEVALIRTADQAPMGNQITNAAGEAVWFLAPALEYEFILPDQIELDQNTVNQLGDMGLTGLGVKMGPINSGQPLPAIVVGIVLGNETAVAVGNYAFLDAAPQESIPVPVIIPAYEYPDEGESLDLVVLPDPITATPAAMSEDVPQTNKSVLWWVIAGMALLLLVTVGIWLYPVLRVLWN